MKKIIKNILPESVKTKLLFLRERFLSEEICKLPVNEMGVSKDVMPWVKLSHGLKFYGFFPDANEMLLYRKIRHQIPHVTEECFAVIAEIVNRYIVPRCIPGEMVFNNSRYKPLRDPLNDIKIPQGKKKEIADLFRPKKGENIIDVGAYIGYGTLRTAQLVGPDGKIIAFESDPAALSLLRRNIEENGISNVIIISKAAADYTAKQGVFYKTKTTANSLRGEVLAKLGYKDFCSIEVNIDTIDNILKELDINKIDHISITINGGEPEALAGAQNTLRLPGKKRVSLAGWYKRQNKRICDIVEPELHQLDYTVIKGRLGRVLAWKE